MSVVRQLGMRPRALLQTIARPAIALGRTSLGRRALMTRPVQRVARALIASSLRRAGGVVEIAPGVRMRLDPDDLVERTIYLGAYETHARRTFEELLRPGVDVLDVGAHSGLFTLLAASVLAGRGEVHAFEPEASALARLRRNVELNGFSKVFVNETAVSDAEGVAQLSVDSSNPFYSSIYRERGDRSVEVRTTSIDAYVKDKPLEIGLIKIDVEGAEASVLRGAAHTLERWRPDLLMEVHRYLFSDPHREVREIADLLSGRGYCTYLIESDGTGGFQICASTSPKPRHQAVDLATLA